MNNKLELAKYRISAYVYKYETNAELLDIIKLIDGFDCNKSNKNYMNSERGVVIRNVELTDSIDGKMVVNHFTIVPLELICKHFGELKNDL